MGGRAHRWVELCAGSAAVTLALLGGKGARAPGSWRGAKTGYAGNILGALGLRPGQGAEEVFLVEIGPWGLFWSACLAPGGAERIASHLRRWERVDPIDFKLLWRELLHADLPADPDEQAARWLLTNEWTIGQFVAIEGKRLKAGGGFNVTRAQGGGEWQKLPWGPDKVAARVEAVGALPWPVATQVFRVDVGEVQPDPQPQGTFVYFDPPYAAGTGYGFDLPRATVLTVAKRWEQAGARVAVSEAEPLPLDGWRVVDLTEGRVRGTKRTMGRSNEERLTLSAAAAWAPGRQGRLGV